MKPILRTAGIIVWALMAFGAARAQATDSGGLPNYQPATQVSGTLRSWGNTDMAGMLRIWQGEFSKAHPAVQYSDTLKGTETAQAGLYAGVADLALMGREILPLEVYPLFRREHHFALEITVATAAYDDPSRTSAVAFFVNKENPLSRLTLKQLDGIFGEQRNGYLSKTLVWHDGSTHGPADDIRTWGQLGLTGDWAGKPIHPYGYPTTVWARGDVANGAANFVREKIFAGGDKWNPDLCEYPTGSEIIDALGKDPYGIAYAGLACRTPLVKAIALAAGDGGDYLEPTREDVASRRYPMTRSLYIYIDRTPGEPLDPKVREFLTYVLSRDGQKAIARDGVFLPLTAEEAGAQLRKIQ